MTRSTRKKVFGLRQKNRSRLSIKASRRPSGAYLSRQEARMAGRLNRRFKQQLKWILARLATFSYFPNEKSSTVVEQKNYYDDINGLIAKIPYTTEIVEDIVGVVRPTYKKGVNKAITELDMGAYGITFDSVNENALRYIANIEQLQLSDFRGNIERTTKDRIKQLLIDAAESGQSYNETAKLISQQGDAGVFSRARGQLIAVNQVGHAYGQGNQDVVDKFVSETGAIVQKFWQTVEDANVTPECAANEDAGWIGNTEAFPSGDEQAPRADNPRCRCATRYRTVDKRGNET